MKIFRKILAIISLIALLTSSVGYTLEYHFCTHCEESIETAYFLFPDNPETEHHCSCQDHGDHLHEACCEMSCEFDETKHIEHYSAEITSIVPQNTQDDMGKYFQIALNSAPEITIPAIEKTYTENSYQNHFRPPDKLELHIANCCFRL